MRNCSNLRSTFSLTFDPPGPSSQRVGQCISVVVVSNDPRPQEQIELRFGRLPLRMPEKTAQQRNARQERNAALCCIALSIGQAAEDDGLSVPNEQLRVD
jgi:hypothetical protein